MVIIETLTFTRQITQLIPDDDYRELQTALHLNPQLGDLIQGGGGLRKVRWSRPGMGKRGGVRVIYYWYSPDAQLYMLLAYPKNEQDNLTREQLSALKKLVKQEFGT